MNSAASPPLSLLIADDNEIDRRVLVEMCHRFAWDARAVSSGGELLAEVELAGDTGTLPDCLLVDWHMPHLDGLSAIDTLLSALPAEQMPAVVIVTALDEQMVEMASEAIGNHRVLHKPVQPEALRDVVEASVSALGKTPANTGAATAATPAINVSAEGWPSLRGIDVDAARTNFGGDAEFYRELCGTFAAATPALLEQIESRIRADERESLRQDVHKLRGQLGTLGALDYQTKAGEIEAAIVDGFTYQVDLEALLVHIKALIRDMETWTAQAQN